MFWLTNKLLLAILTGTFLLPTPRVASIDHVVAELGRPTDNHIHLTLTDVLPDTPPASAGGDDDPPTGENHPDVLSGKIEWSEAYGYSNQKVVEKNNDGTTTWKYGWKTDGSPKENFFIEKKRRDGKTLGHIMRTITHEEETGHMVEEEVHDTQQGLKLVKKDYNEHGKKVQEKTEFPHQQRREVAFFLYKNNDEETKAHIRYTDNDEDGVPGLMQRRWINGTREAYLTITPIHLDDDLDYVREEGDFTGWTPLANKVGMFAEVFPDEAAMQAYLANNGSAIVSVDYHNNGKVERTYAATYHNGEATITINKTYREEGLPTDRLPVFEVEDNAQLPHTFASEYTYHEVGPNMFLRHIDIDPNYNGNFMPDKTLHRKDVVNRNGEVLPIKVLELPAPKPAPAPIELLML